MKVKFRQTGGVAGLAKSADLETEAMTPEEEAALRELVEQADFFRMQQAERAVMPDSTQYQISIESQGRTHDIYLNHSGLPEALKPLVKFLAKLATYEKR